MIPHAHKYMLRPQVLAPPPQSRSVASCNRQDLPRLAHCHVLVSAMMPSCGTAHWVLESVPVIAPNKQQAVSAPCPSPPLRPRPLSPPGLPTLATHPHATKHTDKHSLPTRTARSPSPKLTCARRAHTRPCLAHATWMPRLALSAVAHCRATSMQCASSTHIHPRPPSNIPVVAAPKGSATAGSPRRQSPWRSAG